MGDHQLIGNRFEIGALIGQGGMGDVYLGVDTLTEELVAIKSLKSEILIGDPGLVERFEREGEALRRLNHPNIIKMLASIRENDRHYLVMEYVGGGSLRELLLTEEHLPVERVLEIALDLADALTRAHRLNIIHRDIKPANVLLAEDGTPRLGDFGVAHMGDRTSVTESGSIIGTYAYMSPEGCMGDDLDSRADIWSFGVMLYEMLAGRRPFEGTQPAAVLTAILSKPVPDLLQYRPDAPAALIGLIYSMLEKNREQRISSVRLVGAQLEAFIKGSDTSIQRMTNLFGDPNQPTPGSGIQVVQTGDSPPLEITHPGVGDTTAPITVGSILERSTSTFTMKRVIGAPRIFVSYRREDSIAVTGRIYDRLVEAFGESYVFKDVDKIPLGANFKTTLENEIASCDVLLVVIGRTWLDVRTQAGQWRLDDPNDFVQIEVQTALQRPDMLVIPVLVENAPMPTLEHLPASLADLAYRNAAVVRNDPDFNRDVGWLIQQIRRDFVILPPPRQRTRLPLVLAALALLLIVVFGVWLLPILQSANNNPSAGDTPQPSILPTVEPIMSGEYMVLVADIERFSGEARGVTQLIMDDLHQQFETISFSNLRIRHYQAVIHSDAEAVSIADSLGAAVIIWGNYDDSGATVKVQTGTLRVFPPVDFSRENIENVTNVRLQITDPRRQSAAPAVLAIMGMLHTVSANIFELGRNKAIYDSLTVDHATVLDNTTAAQYQDYFADYSDNPDHALEIIDQAITDNSSNPLPYISRALIRQSLGQFTTALQDTRTAALLGPKDWLAPTYLYALNHLIFQPNYPQGITELDQIIAQHPNDWYAYGLLGLAHYQMKDYASARVDFDNSNAHNPQANYFYPYAISVALRQGRLSDASKLIREVMTLFPDPEATRRILDAGYGAIGTQTAFGPAFSAFGNMLLGQWDQALKNADAALATNPDYAEVYLFRGIVDCNLERYSDAEADYTRLLELDPSFTLVYGLRAEVLLKQSKLVEAVQDGNAVLKSDLGDVLKPFIPLIQSGKLTCENFFDYDFESVAAETPAALAAATSIPATLIPTPEATAQVLTSAANEYTVLVAQLEPLGAERDVTRFIVRDLTGKLEQDIPFSRIQIKSYPQIIKSDDEARQAAEAEGASVVVWGNYTPDLIELEVQVGSLGKFPNMGFDRQTLEQSANVIVRMTDERSESVVNPVLGVLTVLQAADGNGYETLRTMAMLDQINVPPLEIEGDGLSAHIQRSVQQYMTDTPAAVDEIDKALAIDPGNPLAYTWRGAAHERLGQLDEALQDITSALRRAPQGWAMPLYLRGNATYLKNDYDGAIDVYTQIIQQRPDEWFPYNMRGWFYYLKGEFDLAKADYARAFELEPDTNFPYIVSALIALREGRMNDARTNLNTVLRDYPDPSFANRFIKAAFGDQVNKDVIGRMFAAVGDFTLGQYDQMLTDLQKALAIAPELSDLHALEGFALCNLKQYPEAEQAYNDTIALVPDVPLMYVLRADVRLKQLNLLGANEDDNQARQLIEESGEGKELIPYLDYGLRGQVGCENFLDWQPPK